MERVEKWRTKIRHSVSCLLMHQASKCHVWGPAPNTQTTMPVGGRGHISYEAIPTLCARKNIYFSDYWLLSQGVPARNCQYKYNRTGLRMQIFFPFLIPESVLNGHWTAVYVQRLKKITWQLEYGRVNYTSISPARKRRKTTYSGNKKRISALLVDKRYRVWNTKLPSILFALKNRHNDITVKPPSIMVFGNEPKWPGLAIGQMRSLKNETLNPTI